MNDALHFPVPENKTSLNEALAEIFSHLRDVSLRDGVQSWDSNRWPCNDILEVAKEINQLAVTVKKAGGKLPPAEVWGGGQVVNSAMYVKEDPFVSLEKIHEAMPDVDLQCLYRGRQCFGFKPVSQAVQKKAIDAAIERGATHFRVFDFMNDPKNLEHGFAFLKEKKKTHPGIIIEGAVSYTMEPKDGTPPAWSHEDYAKYALKLAQMGSDEIAIKNFAGKDDDKMPALVTAIRTELGQHGFGHLAVNLHSHGQKPETFAQAIDAGAQKVDVAIGSLSAGPSHTNMRDMVNLMLDQRGFDPQSEAVLNHPVMRQLAETEQAIDNVLRRRDKRIMVDKDSFKMGSLEDQRGLIKTLFNSDLLRERIERSPMAMGAISDIAEQRITESYWNSIKEPSAKLGIRSRDELFVHTLDIADQLWEKSGQMGPVTPGAKILADQAIQIYLNQELHKKLCTDVDTLPLGAFTPEYKDVLAGRWGENKGMKEGPGDTKLGDTKLRDAFMMYDALGALDEAVKAGRLKDVLAQGAYEFTPLDKFCALQGGKDAVTLTVLRDEEEPQKALKNTDIDKFRATVEKAAWIPEDTKKQMLQDLTPGRSPDPQEGLEVGEQNLATFKQEGIDVAMLHKIGKRVSPPEVAALLTQLMPEVDKSRQLFAAIARAPAPTEREVARG